MSSRVKLARNLVLDLHSREDKKKIDPYKTAANITNLPMY
jgi:hypothetical protein